MFQAQPSKALASQPDIPVVSSCSPVSVASGSGASASSSSSNSSSSSSSSSSDAGDVRRKLCDALARSQADFDRKLIALRLEFPQKGDAAMLRELNIADDTRFDQMASLAGRILGLARSAAAHEWSEWPRGAFACSYDGAVSGPFHSKAEATNDIRINAKSKLATSFWQVGVVPPLLLLEESRILLAMGHGMIETPSQVSVSAQASIDCGSV